MTVWTTIPSPIGELLVTGDASRLTGLWVNGEHPVDPGWQRDERPFAEVAGQLAAYFAGALRAFTVPLGAAGTPFQRDVWRSLGEIPYGTTTTYRDLAGRVGRPTAIRAVGAANGANPFSIVVPCHRVIGSDGSLTGYGGGLEAKRWLLEHERRVVAG